MNKRMNTLFDILMFILKNSVEEIDEGKCQTCVCVCKIIPYSSQIFVVFYLTEKPTHLRKLLLFYIFG